MDSLELLSVPTVKHYTDLADFEDFDWIDGHIVARGLGAEAALTASSVTFKLYESLDGRREWMVLNSKVGFQIFPHSQDILRASVCIVRRDDLPEHDTDFLFRPPVLVVEFVSFQTLARDLRVRVGRWLEAGVPLVWVINPPGREVIVYRAHGHHELLVDGDEITGVDVIPGLTIPIGDFFEQLDTISRE